jgi:pyridoxine 4-dehydrogenase
MDWMTNVTAAETWMLGDIPVRRIGFGAMRLTGTAAFDLGVPRDREKSISVLRRAIELGVNHIDTASFYFSSLRSANELINTALSPYRDDVLIATKVGPSRAPSGEWMSWAGPEELRGQVEENLRQLGRDTMDLVYLRVYGTNSIAEHVGALAEMQTTGMIRHVGLSTMTLDQLGEARAITPIVAVQHRYGIDARTPQTEAVLAACADAGIAFIPYFAIAGEGRERGAVANTDSTVEEIARQHGASVAQVRLAWTLSRGPQVLAIPGTGNLDHLVENIETASLRLDRAAITALDSLVPVI